MLLVLIINHLINSSITAGILIILILAVKKAFRDRVNARWHYYIWLILILRLTFPYLSAFRLRIDYMLIFIIWIAGASVLALYSILHNMYFWSKVKNGKVLTEQSAIELLESCKDKIGVKVSISIIRTSGIDIPAIFGAKRPWLLMPEKVITSFDHEKLRYVMLHELTHLKRRDILFNWITYILEIVYWFNPLVWLAFHRMRLDRELACDEDVMACLDSDEVKMYGHTILDMAELISSEGGYAGIAGILERRSQLNDRIKLISTFGVRNRKVSVISILITVLLSGSMLVNAGDYIGSTKLVAVPETSAEERVGIHSEIKSAGLVITDGIRITTDTNSYHTVYADESKLPDGLPDEIYMSIVCTDDVTEGNILYMASQQQDTGRMSWLFDRETHGYYRFKESDSRYIVIFLYDADLEYIGYYIYQIPAN